MLGWVSMVGIPSDGTSNLPWFLKNYPLWLWDQSTSSLHILGQGYLDLKTNLVEGGLNTCAELSFTFKWQASSVKEIDDYSFWFSPDAAGWGNGTDLCHPEHLPLLYTTTCWEAALPHLRTLYIFSPVDMKNLYVLVFFWSFFFNYSWFTISY